MSRIYLDHAATTCLRPEAYEAMLPYFQNEWGNPSSLYDFSDSARRALTKARAQAASLIHAKPECIYFTSGGTEADNWALRGVFQSCRKRGRHIIVSSIEHHAILHTAAFLEQEMNCSVTYLAPDSLGRISPEALQDALTPETILVSIMMANNEIGTIQPISELAAVAHRAGCLFHTDAVQAYGQIPIDVNRQGIDLLSVSAHKIYGPKGIGFLYIRPGLTLPPLLFGGAQENGFRGGTENVPAIVGFGEAARLAGREMRVTMRRETAMRDYLIHQILTQLPYTQLNGCPRNRLPGNTNFSFRFVEGSSLLMMLDAAGICASSGSACSSASAAPSHVLTAIGLDETLARASLRLTLGRETTQKELDTTISVLIEIVNQLRSISDEYQMLIQ